MAKRTGLILALVGSLAALWYGAQFEGRPRPIDPLLVAALPEVPAWQPQPTLVGKADDPDAIYVVRGFPGADGRFDAVRLDLRSAARSPARIGLGPTTDSQTFEQAEHAGTAGFELHGLALRRPTPFLLKFPGPGGPGLGFVDSATGVAHVVAATGTGKRSLLTLAVVNSSRLPQARSQLWSDQSRRIAAFLWPEGGSWRLYLFALNADSPGLAPARE